MKNLTCHQPQQRNLWPLATGSFTGSYPAVNAIALTNGNMVETSIRGEKDQFEGWDG